MTDRVYIEIDLRTLDKVTEKRLQKLDALIRVLKTHDLPVEIDLCSRERKVDLESKVIESVVERLKEIREKQADDEFSVDQLQDDEQLQNEFKKIAEYAKVSASIERRSKKDRADKIVGQIVDEATRAGIKITAELIKSLVAG